MQHTPAAVAALSVLHPPVESAADDSPCGLKDDQASSTGRGRPDADIASAQGRVWSSQGALMIVVDILFSGFAATFACTSVFVIVFIARGTRYKELSDPDYSRLTLGNPLTALFINRLLTHEGLRFRSVFCKTLLALWGVVLVAGIIESHVG